VQAPFTNTSEFISFLPGERVFVDRLSTFSPTVPGSSSSSSLPYVGVSEISLNELDLSGSKVTNSFVLDMYSQFTNQRGFSLKAINLSFTAIIDTDLLPILRNTGSSLVSLNLKGCLKLGSLAAEVITKFSSKRLEHFGAYDEVSAEQLVGLLACMSELKYLDLSHCRYITAVVFDAMGALKYLDLSNLNCNLEKAALKSWLSKHGRSLEAILLAASPSDAPEETADDSTVAALAQTSAASLALLDLSYCRGISAAAVKSLYSCAQLQVLRLGGAMASELDGQCLARLLVQVPMIDQLELRRRHGSVRVSPISNPSHGFI